MRIASPTSSFVALSLVASLVSAPAHASGHPENDGQTDPPVTLTPGSQTPDTGEDPENGVSGSEESHSPETDHELPQTTSGESANSAQETTLSDSAFDLDINRIMLSGDSTTQGGSGDWTWRYRLWSHLDEAGEDVDFVGPFTGLYDTSKAEPEEHVHSYREPDFDQDHNALWGHTVAEARETIQEEVEEYDPDLLTLLLGLNDLVWFGTSPSELDLQFRDYVDNARAGNPDLHLVLAEILPSSRAEEDEEFAAHVEEVNQNIAAMADELSTEQSPITVIDVADLEGFEPDDDTYDGVHPSANGELKIAAAVADTLDDRYSVGEPHDRPLPHIEEEGPAGEPELTLTEITPGEVELEWTHVEGATSYWVWVREPDESEWTRLPYPLSQEHNPWVSEGLLPGGEYEYRVQAAKGNIAGEFSNTVAYEISGDLPDPPEAVSGFTVDPGDGEAQLSWNEAENATGYYVHARNLTLEEEDYTRLPYPVSGAEWTDDLLVNGTEYEFRLRSVNGFTEGAQSDSVAVTPTVDPPSAPDNLSATSGNSEVHLEWDSAENATAYHIYTRDLEAGEEDFTQLPYPVTDTEWTVEALRNGADHEFRVRSVSGLIEGAQSDSAAATPTGPAPSAPTDFEVHSGNRHAVLTWDMPENATCVYIQFRDVAEGDSSFTELPFPVCDDSWVAEDLLNGGHYEYRIQAYNGLISGGTTSAQSAEPSGPGAAGPESLTVTSGDRNAALSWTGSSEATSYYVWVRAVTLDEDWERLPTALDQTHWIDRGLVNGATYEFRVQSVDGYEEGGYSNTVEITVNGPTPQVSGLSVATSVGEATLSWNRFASADGYEVFMRNQSAGESFTRMPYPVTDGSWTAEYLTPGDTYEFQVMAVNGLQEGDRTDVVGVTVPEPATPSGFSVSRSGPYAADLSWNPVPEADGYVVYHGVSSDPFTQPTMEPMPFPATETSLRASYLFETGFHWFAVAATTYGSAGARSDATSMTPLMRNLYHYQAHHTYFTGPALPGSSRSFTSAPQMGTDGGILVSRAFIADEGGYGWMSDHRGYDAAPHASSRIHAAWDADQGRLSGMAQSSCASGTCAPAYPIDFSYSGAFDGVPLLNNHLWSEELSNLYSVSWKAPNSMTGALPALSWHIDATTAFRHEGGSSFSATLVADGFPTYEVYQYPVYSTNGEPSTNVLTRCSQDTIDRLTDTPDQRRTC